MRKIIGVATASLALLIGSTSPAVAAETSTDDVAVSVQPGTLSVSLKTVPTFSGVIPSGPTRTFDGFQDVIVSDRRGTGAGYRVIQNINSVAYNGSADKSSVLQAKHFSVNSSTRSGSLDRNAASSDSGLWPTIPLVAGGNLGGSGQVILAAEPGQGMGSYEFGYLMRLEIPSDVMAGDYTATLTTSVVSGNL